MRPFHLHKIPLLKEGRFLDATLVANEEVYSKHGESGVL